MRAEGRKIIAEHPSQPIKGMGVSGLLTSEMFGLTSTVDTDTQELLEKQRRLSAKEEPLSDPEKDELEKVNAELEGMEFRYQVRDPEYTQYLKEQHRAALREEQASSVSTTGPVSPRIQNLLRDAVNRVRGGDQGGAA